MKKISIVVVATCLGVLTYQALKTPQSAEQQFPTKAQYQAGGSAVADRSLQKISTMGESLDPSQLGIPKEIDFAENAFTVTAGAIHQGHSEDRPPKKPDTHPSVVREKIFRFDETLLNLVKNIPEGDPLPQIRVPLFDGEEVDIQFVRHEKIDSRNGSLIGVVMDTNQGKAILGYSDEAQSGTIRITDEEVYSVFYNGNSEHRLVEVDLSKAPPCGHGEGAHAHEDE